MTNLVLAVGCIRLPGMQQAEAMLQLSYKETSLHVLLASRSA